MIEIPIEELLDEADPRLVNKWKGWCEKNPHVYEEFKNSVLMLHRLGVKRYSAWAIINKIRWDHTIRTRGEPFKIGNDYIALFARRVVQEFPELKDFFKLKKMKKKRLLHGEYIDAEEVRVV